jgi:hypothetical protein
LSAVGKIGREIKGRLPVLKGLAGFARNLRPPVSIYRLSLGGLKEAG